MDAILFWNKVALDAVAKDHTGEPAQPRNQRGPTRTARALAIVHLAMYDAFNSIRELSKPYLPKLESPTPGSSTRAAVAEAAVLTLIDLYPAQADTFLQKNQEFLARIDRSTQDIENGRLQGRKVAAAILQDRKDDGSDNDLPYAPSAEPGYHRPDPLNPSQGFLTPNWGQVKTFTIANFLAVEPPAFDSDRYRCDFDDVKAKGVLSGGTRTPEETAIGLFWAYDGAQKLGTPPRLYNQIVREIAIKKENKPAQNARLFALVNMAMADAGIQCWLSKYHYNYWRPVLGIREADVGSGPTGGGDGNPATQGDPFWLPFGAPRTNEPGRVSFTPNFPAYPSGHATFGAASLGIVRQFYGSDNIPFEFVSDELDGKSVDRDGSIRTKLKRSYNSLSKAIEENGRSRVYLGVHWQFDSDGGIDAGNKVANMVFPRL
jgi:hypothetical protein